MENSIFPQPPLEGQRLGGLQPGAPMKRPRARAKIAGYLLAFHATTYAALDSSSSSGGRCGRQSRETIGSDMLSMLKRKREEEMQENLRSGGGSGEARQATHGAKGGTSRFKGVSWKGANNKWQARIKVAGKLEHLGLAATEEGAARKYDARARSLGRPVNFPSQEAACGSGSNGPGALEAGIPDCSSRYSGVQWDKSRKLWRVVASIEGKRRHLGYFDEEEEAARKHDEAASLTGAPLNFPTSPSPVSAASASTAVTAPAARASARLARGLAPESPRPATAARRELPAAAPGAVHEKSVQPRAPHSPEGRVIRTVSV